ncbi:MAG: beta galactosidase jelly roll domain-containing protein [Ignavibacteriales bacterium]|nr:MAG: beta galactosidase jelly roll domain-containing protein [Ignavibacteriales bacterium]
MLKKICLLLALFILPAYGQVTLPKLISDGMILQRDVKLYIWGWASAGEHVVVNFLDASYSTEANSKGEWKIVLPELEAGGPYDMTISSSNRIIIKDILIGDVWICSGQSNMELTMERASPLYEDVIANSENSFIRQFEVPDRYNFNTPMSDLHAGEWKKANPKNVLTFSAVAYFFAKKIYEEYKIPVGLINASLGGSPVQAWMSEEALIDFPEQYSEAIKFKDDNFVNQIIESDKQRINKWYAELWKKDKGIQGSPRWYENNLNTSDWKSMNIPGYWAESTDLGLKNGVVWFRKNFDVPATLAGREVKLFLGRIVDADSVYVNGVFIGTTSYQYPPRRYKIPEGVFRQGENTIVIRVINNSGSGGFVPDKDYNIVAENSTIDLTGLWQYKLGAEMKSLAPETFIRWKPLGLYNGMIAPLLNYKIKGAIWYQGEAGVNVDNPDEYAKLFPSLIKNWREKWQQGDFPFLFVQLPNFMETKDEPAESGWARIREAQLKTLSVKNTGMAVTIDIGEWNDIHPLNKKDVGERLFIAAQKVAYGKNDVVYSGPIYNSMKVEDAKVIISFTNTGSGLKTSDGKKLKYFSIAGEDKNFVWANAKIEDDQVIVWSDKVKNPVAVRYAWADNPDGANLCNKENLLASPFRTDNF